MNRNKIIVIILAMVASAIAMYFSVNVKPQETEVKKEENNTSTESPKTDSNVQKTPKEEETINQGAVVQAVKEKKSDTKKNIESLSKKSIFIYKNKQVNGMNDVEEKIKVITEINGKAIVTFNKKKHNTIGIEEQSVLLDPTDTHEKHQETKEVVITKTAENQQGTQIAKSIEEEIKTEATELQKKLDSYYKSKGNGEKTADDYTVTTMETETDKGSQYNGKLVVHTEISTINEKFEKKVREQLQKEGKEDKMQLVRDYKFKTKEIYLHYNENNELIKIEIFDRYNQSTEEIKSYADLSEENIQKKVENNIYVMIPKWEEANYMDATLVEAYKNK